MPQRFDWHVSDEWAFELPEFTTCTRIETVRFDRLRACEFFGNHSRLALP